MVRGLDVAQGALAGDVLPVPTAAGWIRYEHRLEVELRVALLPAGQDPDDVIRQDPAVWEACVKGAVPVLSYLFDALTADLDLDEPPGKTEAVRRLMPMLATIPDPVSRAAWVEDFADRIRIDPRAMSAQLAGLVGRGKGEPGAKAAPIARRRSDPESRIGALLLGHLLRDPELVAPLAGELAGLGQEPLQPEDYSGGLERDLLIALMNAARGVAPPDTLPEHRLDTLPAEHAARRLELIAAVDSEPELADDRAIRNLRIAVLHLRRVRRQRDLEGLRFLIADADATERPEYASRAKDLGTKIFDLEKLLSPSPAGFGKVDQAVTRRRDI
jgi:DNA primase